MGSSADQVIERKWTVEELVAQLDEVGDQFRTLMPGDGVGHRAELDAILQQARRADQMVTTILQMMFGESDDVTLGWVNTVNGAHADLNDMYRGDWDDERTLDDELREQLTPRLEALDWIGDTARLRLWMSPSVTKMDAQQRLAIMDRLEEQSGGKLRKFFTAHGYGQVYDAPAVKNSSKADKIGAVFTAAERDGQDEKLLVAARDYFGAAAPADPPVSPADTWDGAGVPPKPLNQVRDALEDLHSDVITSGTAMTEHQANTTVDQFNELLDDLAAYRDEVPAPLHLPPSATDETEHVTDAGVERMRRGIERALNAIDHSPVRDKPQGAELARRLAENSPNAQLVGDALAGVAEPQESDDMADDSVPTQAFIVHGRDPKNYRVVVKDLIQSATDLKPIILDEQLNKGKTLIDKLKTHATGDCVAIVIMTADDIGRLVASDKPDEEQDQPRPRQNVVLELGYFIAKLPAERVIVLTEPGTVGPSDFDGVAYYSLAEANWKNKVAKELHGIGVEVAFENVT